MVSKLFQQAFWVEDLSCNEYISLDIPYVQADEWKHLYHRVTKGYYLARDKEGNGYYFENPKDDWMIVRDLKPIGKTIQSHDEKETILKCLELKSVEQEQEYEEARKRWMNYK